MGNHSCFKCGTKLKLGDFAFNQDTCFECFKKEALLIIERVDQYPSWLWDKRDEHKDILNWMLALVSETYGYKWQISKTKEETMTDKKQFVQKCGELLRIAKPHLINAEYRRGEDMPKSEFTRYASDGEYALITCENGYTYGVDITCNSLNAIAEAIFHAMAHK